MTVTNAMRLLKQAGIDFDVSTYEVDESDLSGVHLAEMLRVDVDCVFKTLVTRSDKRNIYVFCIPAAQELDLKKCAAAVGEKKIEMTHVKELLGLTGYIRGGCSPVGMKKKYPTVFDETALLFDKIYVSAGQRGVQMIVDPVLLAEYVQARFADITK